MRREKTVLDVELSESQKREVFSQVVKEHADWNRKISADQQRQQEQVNSSKHPGTNPLQLKSSRRDVTTMIHIRN